MKIVAIIQARMGSSRLPGKVLMDLEGESVLVRCVKRTLRAETLDGVLVATTKQSADEAIVHLCAERDWPCFQGSEDDVLDRYYHAAIANHVDVVVRITSDCPLIEPEIVDKVVQGFLELQPGIDFACNIFPRRTFPRGLETEVIRFDVLEHIWRKDNNPASREHVTPYIYRNREKFRIRSIVNGSDYSSMRWTVDTSEDLAFVRLIYAHFGHDYFSWREVISLLESHPEWLEINRYVEQKKI